MQKMPQKKKMWILQGSKLIVFASVDIYSSSASETLKPVGSEKYCLVNMSTSLRSAFCHFDIWFSAKWLFIGAVKVILLT